MRNVVYLLGIGLWTGVGYREAKGASLGGELPATALRQPMCRSDLAGTMSMGVRAARETAIHLVLCSTLPLAQQVVYE